MIGHSIETEWFYETTSLVNRSELWQESYVLVMIMAHYTYKPYGTLHVQNIFPQEKRACKNRSVKSLWVLYCGICSIRLWASNNYLYI